MALSAMLVLPVLSDDNRAGGSRRPIASSELSPLITNCEMRVNKALTGKRAYYYCDDAIWFFRDLARQRPKLLFDNPFLKALKAVHDKYGFKAQVNCFYRTDFFYGMDEFTLAEITNDEVLEINQDELGAQAARVRGCELAKVWAKPMPDGSLVFALLNKTTDICEVAVELEWLGVRGSWRVRDFWRCKDHGIWSKRIPCEVYPHATELLRLYPVDADSRLVAGLRDIRDNATYLQFDRACPVDKPGLRNERMEAGCGRCQN